MTGAMGGQILETYVFGEILKSYWHNGKDPRIYFYRDAAQREIDFIIEENMTLYPIDVKKQLCQIIDIAKNFNVLTRLDKKIAINVVIRL
jgi:predicted AAA+ superfamily ATPase